jgi:hypothetical protein
MGSRDSIPRVHIIWYQSKVSNQVLFYLFFLAYLILGHHCSRVTKKKKKKKKTWLLKFIVQEFVLVETSCSRVCVG